MGPPPDPRGHRPFTPYSGFTSYSGFFPYSGFTPGTLVFTHYTSGIYPLHMFFAKCCCKFLAFFSFLPLKMLKMTILTSVWSAQHPKASQNIQQLTIYQGVHITYFTSTNLKTGLVIRGTERIEIGTKMLIFF